MGGGDKALCQFRGTTLIAAVIARLSPQVAGIAINAGGDPARYASFGLPVVADSIPEQPGPLAGILAAMDWTAARGAETVVTAPCDTPFLPADLVARLLDSPGGGIVLAASAGRTHPTVGLWPVSLRTQLRNLLLSGERKVLAFADRQDTMIVEYPPTKPDSFSNINTAADLAALVAL